MELSMTFHGRDAFRRNMPLINPGGGADLKRGAALLAGTTVSKGGLIRGTGACADFVGVLDELAASASFGTVAAGTLLYKQVILEPYGIWRAEWSQDDKLSNDVASATTSAVTFTTTQDDDFDGGYIYVVSGTGSGQLRHIGAANTTVMTVATNMEFTTALDTTSDVLMINCGPGTQLCDLATDATKLLPKNGSSSAATGRLSILWNEFQSDSHPPQELKPSSHGELDSLTNPKFFGLITFTNTVVHKID